MEQVVGESKPLRRSLQLALAAALVVLAAGMVFAFTQQGRYQAETSLIMLPANTLPTLDQANLLDTLSSGQVPASMAEVARSGRFEAEASTAMGLSSSEAASSTVTVAVTPSTSVLVFTAQASTAKIAEGLADRTAVLAAAYINSTLKTYTATHVKSAFGTAAPAGTSRSIVVAGVAAAALAVAVAAQQASYQLLTARRSIRRPVPAGAAEAAGTVPVAAAGPATYTTTPTPTEPTAPVLTPVGGGAADN
jgi:capsular polysaccharide biosynthesis protein